MSDIDQMRNDIPKYRRTKSVYEFLKSQKVVMNRTFVSFECGLQRGEIKVPVRNTKCNSTDCVWDMDSILNYIHNQGGDAPSVNSIKCPNCQQFLQKGDFYLDADMDMAQNYMKQNCPEQFYDLTMGGGEYSVYVTQKNEWILEEVGNPNNHVTVKESEMLNEYEKNYPKYPSKMTPEFYQNSWVFINDNVNVQNNGKLQSVLYLFFPSLATAEQQTQAWKEVHIFVNKDTNVQNYFNEYMSVCKYYNSRTKQHGIIASGGLGYPEKQKYVNRAFIVNLFSDDPMNQIEAKVDMIEIQPMTSARVFHQLIQYRDSIYALGGYMRDMQKETDIAMKTCERYNFATNQWEKISDLATPRQLFTATVYQDKLYVVGGKVSYPNSKTEDEDFTVEIFDGDTNKWTSYVIFQEANPNRYFTERAYCFVKENNTLVVFGGRKEKMQFEQRRCDRARQAVELNLQNGLFKVSNDQLPETGIIGFEGATDFKGIFFNQRHIFGFKRYVKENNSTFMRPSVCKYQSQGANKFSIESWKKIAI